MNKSISQFESTAELQVHDLITVVQDKTNKNIAYGDFTNNLSNTFATNEQLSSLENNTADLETQLNNKYTELNETIKNSKTEVVTELSNNLNDHYESLDAKITELDEKHEGDIDQINDTVQDWIDDIENRSTLDQLHDALNRLKIAENTITELAKVISEEGVAGDVPGYHTQSTATIFPLSGYYKGNDGSALATTDTLNEALSKLENQIEAVISASGSLPLIKTGDTTVPTDSYIYTAGKVREDYLNKHGDIADGKIVFNKGLQASEIFQSGWDGQGASLYPVGNKWNFEVDDLFVRGNLTVNELVINEIKAVGGDILVTLADMLCTEVQDVTDGYKCFYDNEGGTKYNGFVVNDMAICQKFDGQNAKRYWRKVNEVGDNYIVLSKDVCESGSGIPVAGDNILQLGHMVEADEDYNLSMDSRRNAIFISSKGQNAPRITFYKNIDEFTLADANGVIRERVVIGGDESKFIGTIMQSSNTGITRIPVYRGIWVSGNTYYYYDQVTHDGSLWICMNPNGTKAEPTEQDDDWQKQIAKGDAGKPSDDVAKWVEITGNRLFLYESSDYSGTPSPIELALTANTYGMTNPSYTWTTRDDRAIILSNSKFLSVEPSDFVEGEKNLLIRCVVTNGDGSQYYDEVQVSKLANGAEGTDAYHVDLSNYNVTIPYYYNGPAKIDLENAYTEVFAYCGIEEIEITNITTTTVEGTATASVTNNIVRLTSLDSEFAVIKLTITLVNGIVIDKLWYINNNSDGADGYNGEDASYVYMSGEQIFHYTAGSLIPNPTTIKLQADTFNITNATYKWYWSVAGAYDWQEISNETNSILNVSYNSSYFNVGDEISFKCIVTSTNEITNTTTEYFDFMTINVVRDGESVYRGILTNESTTVPCDVDGTVISMEAAYTATRLVLGSKEVTDYSCNITTNLGGGNVYFDSNTKKITCTSITDDINIFKVDFVYNGVVVDTVDFVITKIMSGTGGSNGKFAVQIFGNKTSVPSTPTFSYIPNGASSSDGTSWDVDPTYSDSSITWTCTGYYDPDTDSITNTVLSSGAYWTDPIPHSGLNGVDGRSISSVVAYYYASSTEPSSSTIGYTYVPTVSSGQYLWMRYKITYDDNSSTYTAWAKASGEPGPAGVAGPSLNFRGKFSPSVTYYWATGLRDVVKYNNTYYAVKEEGSVSPGSFDSNEWQAWTSFENIATGVLFAEDATIGGWRIANDCFYSGSLTVGLSGTNSIALAIGSEGNPGVIYDSTNKVYKINEDADIKLYGTLPLITVGKKAGIYGYTSKVNDSMSSEEKDHIDDDIIRIWAGGDMGVAPFRVYDNGKIVAEEADITGNVTCKTLNVTDYANWGGPGVKAIFHIGHSDGTSETSQNSGELIYSVNNVKVSIHSYLQTGHAKFNLSGITSSYSVLITGITYDTASVGMRATYGVYNVSNTSFTILSVDTDNNNHNLHDVDIIILGY